MTKMIVVKRSPTLALRMHSFAEKLYQDGYNAEQIADSVNDVIRPSMVATTEEVSQWIKDLGWARRPEPRRGERLTPPLPPPTSEGPWEPMFRSWMD